MPEPAVLHRSSTSASSRPARTVVPLNVLLKGREVAYHLRRLRREGLLLLRGHARAADRRGRVRRLPAGRRLRALLRDHRRPRRRRRRSRAPRRWPQAMGGQPATFETVATDEDDTAVILYTSGTTGQPKGAELRHRNMRDNALSGEALFGADADDPDTYLCVLPLFHSFGQTVIQNGAFAYGGTVVMLPRFEAHAALDADAEGEGHLLRRRADDVLGPARRPRRARVDVDGARRATCGSRPPAARRCRSRCTRSSRSASASRSSRATASPRPRRSRAFSTYGEPVRVGSIGAADPRRRDGAASSRRLG